MARMSCLRLAARPTPEDDPAFAVAACSQALVVQYDAASGHNALPIHRDFSLLTMSSALDAGGRQTGLLFGLLRCCGYTPLRQCSRCLGRMLLPAGTSPSRRAIRTRAEAPGSSTLARRWSASGAARCCTRQGRDHTPRGSKSGPPEDRRAAACGRATALRRARHARRAAPEKCTVLLSLSLFTPTHVVGVRHLLVLFLLAAPLPLLAGRLQARCETRSRHVRDRFRDTSRQV